MLRLGGLRCCRRPGAADLSSTSVVVARAGEDVGVGEDGAEEAGVRGDAADVHLGQCPVEVAEGVAEVALPLVDDDLGQQRVVARALLDAGAGRGVDADAGAAGEARAR